MRVIIRCPVQSATGGPELLHQLCYNLNGMGIPSYMWYTSGYYSTKSLQPVHPNFMHYNLPYVSSYYDDSETILVTSETDIDCLEFCEKGIRVIWWLSVDNYFRACGKDNADSILNHLRDFNNIIHLTQSRYAEDFLKKNGFRNIYYLSDYISDTILNYASENAAESVKKNLVLYNPKKGYEITKELIDNSPPGIEWFALEGLAPDELASMLCQGKVYIDFGNHPGKDRIPREAAICGCCVLTNDRGSAAYHEDVPILPTYKFHSPLEEKQRIYSLISDIFTKYDQHKQNFNEYRDIIGGEKERFYQDMVRSVKVFQSSISGNSAEDISEQNDDLLNTLHDINSIMPTITNAVNKSFDLYSNGQIKTSKDILIDVDATLNSTMALLQHLLKNI